MFVSSRERFGKFEKNKSFSSLLKMEKIYLEIFPKTIDYKLNRNGEYNKFRQFGYFLIKMSRVHYDSVKV